MSQSTSTQQQQSFVDGLFPTLPQTKQCRKCGKVLPAEAFYLHRTSKDGLQSYCKECATRVNAFLNARRRGISAAGLDPRLQSFSNIELLRELKTRGVRFPEGEVVLVTPIDINDI